MRFQSSPPRGSIIVIGAGIAGLATGIGLARDGHPVTVLDPDELAVLPDAETAFATPRAGAPQIRQTHGLLARLTQELRARFPDILADLFAAGAALLPLTAELGAARPGDDDLAVLLVRRTTLDWVLRRAAVDQASLTLCGGARVAGLVMDAVDGTQAGAVPVVRGVRLVDGEVLEADAVIVANGRRSALPAWLAEVGVIVAEDEHATNLVYLTRWYRLPAGTALDLDPKLAGDLGFVKFLAIPCDGNTLSITIAVPARDTDLRRTLLDGAAFDRAAAQLPGPDAIFARHHPTPVREVEPLGGLINRLRQFTDEAGEPTVQGLHAVGDAHTCTNPFYGRGCSLALIQSGLLIDAFADHPDDAIARARAYEAGAARETEPWFRHSVTMDATLRIADRGPDDHDDEHGRDEPTDDARAAQAGMAAVMAAGATDPVIGRAMLRVFNMLEQPDDLIRDPEFLARVADVVSRPEDFPPPALPDAPTRDHFLQPVPA